MATPTDKINKNFDDVYSVFHALEETIKKMADAINKLEKRVAELEGK